MTRACAQWPDHNVPRLPVLNLCLTVPSWEREKLIFIHYLDESKSSITNDIFRRANPLPPDNVVSGRWRLVAINNIEVGEGRVINCQNSLTEILLNEKLPIQVWEFAAENCPQGNLAKVAKFHQIQTLKIFWPVYPIHINKFIILSDIWRAIITT